MDAAVAAERASVQAALGALEAERARLDARSAAEAARLQEVAFRLGAQQWEFEAARDAFGDTMRQFAPGGGAGHFLARAIARRSEQVPPARAPRLACVGARRASLRACRERMARWSMRCSASRAACLAPAPSARTPAPPDVGLRTLHTAMRPHAAGHLCYTCTSAAAVAMWMLERQCGTLAELRRSGEVPGRARRPYMS
jgi:hypothetical protein